MPDAPKQQQLPITVDDIDTAPTDGAVSATDTLVSVEDYRNALAQVGQERDELQAELERTVKRVKTTEILDSLIIPYANRTFIFMCAYCGVVGALIALNGFLDIRFSLPESVMQFLVGSTATTVIGLVGMVLTGIFVGARGKGE